ncbi:MAG TPA: hypothetical protein VH087_20315, partial [Thermoanaerobaculia bacterium]|nr:hypothetical protein [Thermoanaerobaculia bacterium]
GIFAAFVSFKFDHLSHVQVVWTGWLPLMLAALLAYWRHADTKHALLLGGAFVMNGLTNIYWLAFGAIALGITIVFLFIVTDRRDAAFWRRLIVTLAVSCAVLLPFLIPYEVVSKLYRLWRRSSESLAGSATPYDFLMPSESSLVYGKIAQGRSQPERHLFLGIVPIILAAFSVGRRRPRRRSTGEAAGAPLRRARILNVAIALFAIAAVVMTRSRHGADVPITLALLLAVIRFAPNIRDFVSRSRFNVEEWTAALWIAIGFAGAFGEHAFLHPILFRLLPIFRATRTPARWIVILHTGIAVWMAIGFIELLGRVPMRRLVAAVVLALTIIDVLPRIEWDSVPAQRPPVYAWIARARPSVFIELPVSPGEPEAQYMLAATTHHVRMMNGVSGFDPPLRKVLVDLCSRGRYDDAFYNILTSNGCRMVVVHNAILGDTAPSMNTWLVSEVQRGRLTPIQHFGDDDVYEVTGH